MGCRQEACCGETPCHAVCMIIGIAGRSKTIRVCSAFKRHSSSQSCLGNSYCPCRERVTVVLVMQGHPRTRGQSSWVILNTPCVQAAWAHLPHWQHMPRMRFRQSSKPGTASRTSTLARTLSRHLSVRRPLFSMRQRSKLPSSHGAKDRPLLHKMLNPLLILEVFRLLTISAAQV